jgi:hypothetical protein
MLYNVLYLIIKNALCSQKKMIDFCPKKNKYIFNNIYLKYIYLKSVIYIIYIKYMNPPVETRKILILLNLLIYMSFGKINFQSYK